jgi:hypothetical protein
MERKYTIIPAEEFDTIDWNIVQQWPEDARWNIAHTEFIISTTGDIDYLPNKNWVDVDTMRTIVQDISWRGEDLPKE